jgi:hypothetical protein
MGFPLENYAEGGILGMFLAVLAYKCYKSKCHTHFHTKFLELELYGSGRPDSRDGM